MTSSIDLRLGDCLEVMAAMPENSVDSVITDPPYHLTSIVKRFGKPGSAPAQYGTDGVYSRHSTGFMGKEWDGGDIAHTPDMWREALRVAKPGAMLMAFGGTRTHHRLMVAIEDAGWILRDTLMWVYAQGFPKSHDISRAIDRAAGAEREVVGNKAGLPGYSLTDGNAGGVAMEGNVNGSLRNGKAECAITAPAIPAARTWDGWGTALKPAWEPIILAMAPLDGTFAHNAEKWGVAGLWIDGARVETKGRPARKMMPSKNSGKQVFDQASGFSSFAVGTTTKGRFPANLIHDGSDEVVGLFPVTKSGMMRPNTERHSRSMYGQGNGAPTERGTFGDSGSAARFFKACPPDAKRLTYHAKASRSERNLGIEGVMLELEVCLCSANEEHTGLAISLERGMSAYVTEMESKGWNTPSSGNGSTDLFHTVTVSTISMETSKTTGSRTWRVSTSLPTSEFIAGAIKMLQGYGLSLVADAGDISQSLNTMSERAGSARGASLVVSETPLRISANARPNVNFHPTCKPLALMEYLCKLTRTPTGGVVLDPFLGSGTTGIACVNTDRDFIGIEIDPDYFEIAEKRIAHAQGEAKQVRLPL